MIFDKVSIPPLLCVGKVLDWLKDYQKVVILDRPSSKVPRDKAKLKAPPLHSIKINFDGAFSIDGDKLGFSFVARDHHGKFLLVGSKSEWFGGSAFVAEAKALVSAAKVSKFQGWDSVMFEGDCKILIDAMKEKGKRGFHLQTLIENCLSMAQSFFSVTFLFCFCECNEVAHRLAKWAVSSFCDETWVDVATSWLLDALYSDVSFIES